MKAPKYPFVTVKLLDLLHEPYRPSFYPTLLKRCSVAARNAQFVPWGMIIKFNMKAIRLNDFHEAFLLAIEWWNVDDWWTKAKRLEAPKQYLAYEVWTGRIWIFEPKSRFTSPAPWRQDCP